MKYDNRTENKVSACIEGVTESNFLSVTIDEILNWNVHALN